MISKDEVHEATVTWIKAELAADDCGAVVRALHRALSCQPQPIPQSELDEIRRAREELTAACEIADAAHEAMRLLAQRFVEQPADTTQAVAAS